MSELPFDPQIIIFIVFLVVGLLKNVLGKGKGEQDAPQFPTNRNARPPRQPKTTRPPNTADDPLSDFKRMIEEARKEAAESKNQQQPIPKAAAPPRQVATTPRQVSAPVTPPVATPFTPPVVSAPAPKASSFPSSGRSSRKRKSTQNVADLSLSSLLRSPASAKQAIILSEVLGKPKGM